MKRIPLKFTWLNVCSASLTILLGFSVQAAEKQKISWTAQTIRTVSRTIANPLDLPEYQLAQTQRVQAYTSPEEDWNNSEALVYDQSDTVAGNGRHRGYVVMTHSNGDKTYHKFEGTHKQNGTQGSISEGTGQFIGGTGKFKNITGTIKYQSKFTPEGGVTNTDAEVEY